VFEGLKEYGAKLLAKFKWGHSFYEVNEELLDMYAKCKTGAECVQKQAEFLKREQEEKLNFNENNGLITFFYGDGLFLPDLVLSSVEKLGNI
jgi:pre-rRNA-processing protein TSR3